MSWSTHLRSAQDFVKVGDDVEAVLLSIDRETRKMSLGIKQLTTDPWTDITTNTLLVPNIREGLEILQILGYSLNWRKE